MARMFEIEPSKTYATVANVVKAVEKRFPAAGNDTLVYFIHVASDGRFFPVFVGQRAITAGVHFHFNVVA
jgi:hypothetical protein